MNTLRAALALLSLLSLLACPGLAQGTGASEPGFWPGWRGPDRSNRSTEIGLLPSWPAGGPPLVWKAIGLGEGIASVSVAGGAVYTVGYHAGREYVFALDAKTGAGRWITSVGPAVAESSLMRWLSQRTPTVDQDRLYTVTATGELFCLATADGRKIWHKSYPADFGSARPHWGFGDRPLVDGEKLICAPAGTNGAVVALDKITGALLWKSEISPPEGVGYGAAVISEACGIRQYVVFLSRGLYGIAAEDGRVLWQSTNTVARYANSYTPIVQGDLVFSANGYGGGMTLLKIVRDGDTLRAETQYSKNFKFNPFQDSTVLVGDHVYASEMPGKPVCIQMRTGQLAWGPIDTEAKDRAAVTFAEGHIYTRRASGRMVLQKASPEAYLEISAFQIPDPEEASGATAPVVAGGRLYLRDNSRLLCYDISAGALGQEDRSGTTVRISLGDAQEAAAIPEPGSGPATARSDGIFVPTPDDIVVRMLALAEAGPKDVVYDLGSGDGRIVLAAARVHGSRAVGYEIDAELVEQSRELIRQANLEKLAVIEHADLFTAEVEAADVITVYLPPETMARLMPLFLKLKPGARVVSHQFKIPGFAPDRQITTLSKEDGEPHHLYLWIAPLTKPQGRRPW